jgi:glyoxalase/bleomycin resistance protein/dioxygenase superfamily protein
MEPVDRTVAAFEVEDIEGEVNELRGRGVEVEGIITLPNGVQRAFFKDPDGNVIGMRQLPGAQTANRPSKPPGYRSQTARGSCVPDAPVVPLWYRPIRPMRPDRPDNLDALDDLDAPGHIGRLCRSAWGPKGRRFKSDRPD